jgi:hypothetical protein
VSGAGWSRRETLRTLSASALAIALPGLLGCGGKGSPTPPAIAIDEDVCDWCHMTIDDPRLVAAFVPASGRALRFGEPGCLLSWLAERESPEGSPFVAAREDGLWLPAAHATFAQGAVRTPMGFDLAAWRGAPAAGADRLTWAWLLEQGAPRARRG